MNKYEGFFEGTVFWGAVGMHNLSDPLSDEPRNPEPVTAYHVFSTAPSTAEKPGDPFAMREYALLTAKLSAMAWRRYNGPIYLVTDERGAAYARETGLDRVYDGVKVLLSDSNRGIPPVRYWASGKVLALRELSLPCAIIDMDLIVWRLLPLRGTPLAAAHTEDLNENVYPDFSFFEMSPRYRFPDQWDPLALPLNTSLLYMEDEALREYYTTESIRFMQYERDTPDNGVWCMVFAEQRILGMCAAVKGIEPRVFLRCEEPLERQSMITHTWIGKRLFQCVPEIENHFNDLCREKISQLQVQLDRLP